MGWPKDARKWSRQEILRDVEQAKELFRQRRLEEPKERYLEAFKSLERANKKVVELLPGLLADPVDPRLLSSLIREEDLLTALRYLGAPPISTDDPSWHLAWRPRHNVFRHRGDPMSGMP